MRSARATTRALDALLLLCYGSHAARREEEDALVDLLGVLAQGQSQRYTLNGNTSTKVSLCRVLGFFSETDYHAFLVT